MLYLRDLPRVALLRYDAPVNVDQLAVRRLPQPGGDAEPGELGGDPVPDGHVGFVTQTPGPVGQAQDVRERLPAHGERAFVESGLSVVHLVCDQPMTV